MTLARLLYKSHLFVAGIALMVLGTGNYLTAVSRVSHYREVMREIIPTLRTEPIFLLSTGTSHFPSEARERWEIARAKRDFYHVVLSAGRFMVGIGLLCAAISLIRLRRQSRYLFALHHSPARVRTFDAQAPSSPR
jgi:hypothetical protein